MIENIEVTGIHTEVDEDVRKYAIKKIGRLSKYMSSHAKKSVSARVKLKSSSVKGKNQYTCEVSIVLPFETITTKETTVNMFAAIDIVETKLKNQLVRYKGQHSALRRRTRQLVNKFRSQSSD